MKLRNLTLLASLGFATSTFAGPIMPVDPAPVIEWTGWYVGVQAGAAGNVEDTGVLNFDRDLDGNYGESEDQIAAFGNSFAGSTDAGGTYGAVLGFDVQARPRIVLGALIDYNFTDLSEDQSGFSATPAFYTDRREIDGFATGRARIGFLPHERFLVYFTGGAVYADVERSYVSNTPATVTERGGDDDWGYALGLGAEARITENWSLTAEYLYTDMGDGDFVGNLAGGPFSVIRGSTDSRGTDEDFDFHTIQFKLIYRF